MKLQFVILAVLTAVNAANYMSQASQMFIKVMTNYKMANIDPGRASSEANRFWTQVAQYPAFQKICNEIGNEQININDMSHNKELIIKYGNQGVAAFNQWQHGPSYSPYVQYVSQHIKDFDISRLVNDATRTVNQYWPFVRGPASSAMNDPQLKPLIQTAAQLAPKVIQDAGLAPYLRNVRIPPSGFAAYGYEDYGAAGGAGGGDDYHDHNL